MTIESLNLAETGFFSNLIIDLVNEDEKLQPFVNDFFQIDRISQFIEQRKQFPFVGRKELSQHLFKQYQNIELSEVSRKNIELLKEENTFTITTAHQLNLFGGPLYYLLKNIHCVKLCKILKEKYFQYNFVPIFWMNTEDHDFEEVNHFYLFNKKVEWQTNQEGAVGLFELNGIDKAIEETTNILGDSENAQSMIQILRESFSNKKNYAEAVFDFANRLFGELGLVILDQQNGDLKKMIKAFFQNELTSHDLFNGVQQGSQDLEEIGYHRQALPRAINLFYINENKLRKRITYEEGIYKVVDTDLSFTEAEMLSELEKNPVRFSTNVISRPIYQQSILPNLAYIGGGGELAYWLQLKKGFEQLNVFYPALILRNSVAILDRGSQKKMAKYNLSVNALFTNIEILIKDYVKNNSEGELSLSIEKENLKKIFEEVITKALKIDATLEKSALGEMNKQLKAFNNLEAKILRAEKKKFDSSIAQIRGLNDKVFPNGKLQERHDNFMQWWIKYGVDFIDKLYQSLDPLSADFRVLKED